MKIASHKFIYILRNNLDTHVHRYTQYIYVLVTIGMTLNTLIGCIGNLETQQNYWTYGRWAVFRRMKECIPAGLILIL